MQIIQTCVTTSVPWLSSTNTALESPVLATYRVSPINTAKTAVVPPDIRGSISCKRATRCGNWI